MYCLLTGIADDVRRVLIRFYTAKRMAPSRIASVGSLQKKSRHWVVARGSLINCTLRNTYELMVLYAETVKANNDVQSARSVFLDVSLSMYALL